MRTIGVEEELLVVDLATGQPRSLASTVIAAVTEAVDEGAAGQSDGADEGAIEGELQRTMVETQSSVATDLATVRGDLRLWRRRAAAAARHTGAAVAALATSPVAFDGQISANERYERMSERFGVTAREVLTCGCHVHVGIDSDDEGVAVLDRMRVWLPLVLAMSSNSPFSDGRDSGYASYRAQMWVRWPSAGPTDTFGSAEGYHDLVRAMTDSQVLLDDGMVYFDARLSHRYPTVEIRVADVCADLEDTLLVAAVCRGLVETAAREAAAGVAAPDVPTSLLRLATWQASREGVDGMLLDPLTSRPEPAAHVLGRLLVHIRDAVDAAGDLKLVTEGLARMARVGSGASVQRRTYARTGRLVDVVAEAARRTSSVE